METMSACWGYGIHDSDSALEWEFSLKKVCGVASRAVTAEDWARQRVKLERGTPKMLTLIREEAEHSGEALIAQGYQVLASLLMEAGCAFDEATRTKLAEGINACPEYTIAKILKAGKDEPLTVLRVFHILPDHGQYGAKGTADRLNGRFDAIAHLLTMLDSYDLTGCVPIVLTTPGPLVPRMTALA